MENEKINYLNTYDPEGTLDLSPDDAQKIYDDVETELTKRGWTVKRYWGCREKNDPNSEAERDQAEAFEMAFKDY